MCSSRKILWSLLLLSLLEVGLGVASIVLGAVGISAVRGDHKPQQGDASPVWSGLCFLVCGMCGVLCARKRTGLIMILFSACCICGLIGGILNFQFVRALNKRPNSMHSVHLAAMTLACLSAGQLRTAEDVFGKGTLTASLIFSCPAVLSQCFQDNRQNVPSCLYDLCPFHSASDLQPVSDQRNPGPAEEAKVLA